LRKFLVAALAAASFAAAAPATAPAQPPVAANVAKSCSSGWKHAVIGGAHKCLRRGQFCAHRYDRQYRRYGYHCRKQDARGNYHLT
jgi:opacity protein-like surface antigen